MTVQNLIVADQEIQVSGVGYVPQGGFFQHDKEIEIASHADLLELFRAGMLCNDAMSQWQNGIWSIQGDPTEAALVVLARRLSENRAIYCGKAILVKFSDYFR